MNDRVHVMPTRNSVHEGIPPLTRRTSGGHFEGFLITKGWKERMDANPNKMVVLDISANAVGGGKYAYSEIGIKTSRPQHEVLSQRVRDYNKKYNEHGYMFYWDVRGLGTKRRYYFWGGFFPKKSVIPTDEGEITIHGIEIGDKNVSA